MIMDEEEFYRQNQNHPKRHPTYQPFGYGPVLNSGNRKWAKWYARFILLLFPITWILIVLLSE